jgi:hypothetical protein
VSEWNAMTYEGKDNLLRVVRDRFLNVFLDLTTQRTRKG